MALNTNEYKARTRLRKDYAISQPVRDNKTMEWVSPDTATIVRELREIKKLLEQIFAK
jgi:hypothetical protein